MEKFFLAFGLVLIGSLLYGQNTSVTNNNTIIIQGNVYYFQPSTTPSSPPPTVGQNNFIGNGSWYGENAARAWASISDWAIERCIKAQGAVRGRSDEIVYISQVHAYRAGSPEIARYWHPTEEYNPNPNSDFRGGIGGIKIYYWIVRKGDRMEDGRRETRAFLF